MTSDGKTILNQFQLVQGQLKKSISEIKKERLIQGAENSLALFDSLRDLAKSFGDQYAELFFSNQEPKLNLRKKSVEQHFAKGTLKKEDVLDFLSDLDKLVSLIGRDIRKFHSRPLLSRNYAWLIPVSLFLLFGAWALALPKIKKNGLSGYYYTNTNLNGSYRKRIDKKISFNWSRKPPFPKYKRENLSVSWEGFVRIPQKGRYVFSAEADGKCWLWLGRRLLFLRDETTSSTSAHVLLKKGYYPIRFDYFENVGSQRVKLKWRGPGWKKERIISSEFLVPARDVLPENSVVHAALNSKIKK